jgi:hypothetical protein
MSARNEPPLKYLPLILLSAATSACTTAEPRIPHADMGLHPGPLREEFVAAHPEPRDWRHPELHECLSVDLPEPIEITEIGLERTACYGYCSEYTATVHSNGIVEYEGRANVRQVGKHSGRISEYQFALLATMLEESGALAPDTPRYFCGVTDSPTVYLSVVKSGERLTIEHYAPSRSGPVQLWLFEEIFDELVSSQFWR